MADVKGILKKGANKYRLILELTKEEYGNIGSIGSTVHFFPSEGFEETLKLGSHGEAGRIIIPKNMINKYSIDRAERRLPSKVLSFSGCKFLIVALDRARPGMPLLEGV